MYIFRIIQLRKTDRHTTTSIHCIVAAMYTFECHCHITRLLLVVKVVCWFILSIYLQFVCFLSLINVDNFNFYGVSILIFYKYEWTNDCMNSMTMLCMNCILLPQHSHTFCKELQVASWYKNNTRNHHHNHITFQMCTVICL